MSKRLEDIIKNNREAFDDLEPSAGLWNKIENKLPAAFDEVKVEAKKTFSLGFVLKIAASIIIVMSLGFELYIHNRDSQHVNVAAISPEYAKQQMHYTALITTKRTELKQLSQSDPQLYQEFSAEIAKMDSTYKKLNSDLATSPNQAFVLHAMIRNLQMQTDILNQQLTVIEQYNQMKKEQQNESKDI